MTGLGTAVSWEPDVLGGFGSDACVPVIGLSRLKAGDGQG